jgi:hypothetical protein
MFHTPRENAIVIPMSLFVPKAARAYAACATEYAVDPVLVPIWAIE